MEREDLDAAQGGGGEEAAGDIRTGAGEDKKLREEVRRAYIQADLLERDEEPKTGKPDPAIYRYFELAQLQREYGLYDSADLTHDEVEMMLIIHQERNRWEAEKQRYRDEWREQKLSCNFEQYLVSYVDWIGEYL